SPPMLWPTSSTGALDAVSITAQRSSTRSSCVRSAPRAPPDRPCPRWSKATTSKPRRARNAATLRCRPACSPSPCTTTARTPCPCVRLAFAFGARSRASLASRDVEAHAGRQCRPRSTTPSGRTSSTGSGAPASKGASFISTRICAPSGWPRGFGSRQRRSGQQWVEFRADEILPMSDPGFVHLRVHTEYSVSDSIVRIEALVERAVADRQPAIAVTDLANLFGWVKFYKAARARGLKPICGVDAWLTNEPDRDRPFRMLLLARDRTGYLRLCRLLSRAWIENEYRGRGELRAEWFD